MSHYKAPASTSSGRPQYSASSSSGAPRTPYIGNGTLPPSPGWSDSSFGSPTRPPVSISGVNAPYMHTVGLPSTPSAGSSRPTLGLPTPPNSPQAARPSIHRFLTGSPGSALIAYNVLEPPTPQFIRPLATPFNPHEAAVSPPAHQLTLRCHASTPTQMIFFPWAFNLRASTGPWLSVIDVLTQIHAALLIPVSEAEFGRFPVDQQQRARFMCTRRIQLSSRMPGAHPAAGGVVRGDFLGDVTHFMGITQTADGLIMILSSRP